MTQPKTLDEIRDYMARRQGWEPKTNNFGSVRWKKGKEVVYRHPVPATLDAIAGLMPEGWRWLCNHSHWFATNHPSGFNYVQVQTDRTGNELLDRARLAMLATLAEDKAKQEDDDGN